MLNITIKISTRGFTLLEIMAAIAIFALVIASATTALNSYQTLNHRGEIRSEASQAAQSVIDEIRTLDITLLPESGSDDDKLVTMNSNRQYTVTVSYCTDIIKCTSDGVRQINVEVLYNDEIVYTTEVVFTDLGAPPGSNYSPTPIPSATSTATATATSTSTPTGTSTPASSPSPSATKKKKCKTWKC